MEEDTVRWLAPVVGVLFLGSIAEVAVMLITDRPVVSGIGPIVSLSLFLMWGLEQLGESSLGYET